jgi:EmrB/QacA subfamily drug resistance transporter
MLSTGFPRADAENDFLRARRQEVLAALARHLRHQPADSNRLLPLDQVIGALDRRGVRRLGLQTIRLDTIVGSVDARHDFDRRFRPTTNRVRTRWERLAEAQRRGEPIPPIGVYRVGGQHFVSDGHHRVSVAAATGQPLIDAYVTEILTGTPPLAHSVPATGAAKRRQPRTEVETNHAASRSGRRDHRAIPGRCRLATFRAPRPRRRPRPRRTTCDHGQRGHYRKPPGHAAQPAGEKLPGPGGQAASRAGSRAAAAPIPARPQTVAAGQGATAGTRPGLGRVGLALILAASFMVVLDFSIVNIALPSIQRELGVSADVVQWVVTAYAIAFGGLLILGGRAGDLYGRRHMFLAGLAVFTAGSLAGGLARDPLLLIASRVVQGTGAALVAPAALSLITTGFPEGPRRTRALGLYGATASVGFVAGQVLGGVLVEFLSWRSVFLVNIPVGLAALALASRALPESRLPRAGRHLDTTGAVLVTTAVAALVFGVSQAGITGPGSVGALVPLGLSGLAGAAFTVAEQRQADPLIRPSLLRPGGLRTAAILMLLLGLWNGGEMLVLSLYLQQVLHFSPLASGLAIAPQGIVGFTAGLFGARLTRRLGIHRVPMLTGLAATIGFVILTQLPAGGGYSPLLAAVMLIGFGTAGTAFATMVIATAGITDADQGLVGGVINTSRQLGAAIGAALLPAVAGAVNRTGQAAATGDRAAMLTGAIAAALATLVAMTARRWPRPAHPPRPTRDDVAQIN